MKSFYSFFFTFLVDIHALLHSCFVIVFVVAISAVFILFIFSLFLSYTVLVGSHKYNYDFKANSNPGILNLYQFMLETYDNLLENAVVIIGVFILTLHIFYEGGISFHAEQTLRR